MVIARLLVLSLLLVAGCSIGVSVHPEIDRPEIDLDTYLGVARLEYKGFFCEHISALRDNEQGAGLNHCGFLIKVD